MHFKNYYKQVLADIHEAGGSVSVFNLDTARDGSGRCSMITAGPVVQAGPVHFRIQVDDISVLDFAVEDILEMDLCAVGYVNLILGLGADIVNHIIRPPEVSNA